MGATRIWKFLQLVVLAGLMGGCVPLRPYHTTAAPAAGTAAPTACYQSQRDQENSACVRFVEYDDFGNLFNRSQLDSTVAAAQGVAQAGGIVVVYVHGWEHNASPGDSDLESFHHAMQNAQALDRQYGDKRTVLGIYVGWRGKSISIPGLSKITFWERKTTAQAVGDGAVFELLRKLANFRQCFPTSRLVVVGHSFGAAVTYSSVSHSIMDQIINDPYGASDANYSTQDQPKRWDMVVLLNPAFEAMQLRPHFELARSRRYLQNQLPHLVLITSEADWATGAAFPLGRYFRSIFNKYADPQSADMYRTAVGQYLPFVTHQLAVRKDCAQFVRNLNRPIAPDKLGTVVEAQYFCFDDTRAMLPDNATGRQAEPVLLTRCDAANDCAEVAGEHYLDAPSHMPIMNIRTTGEVMTGHNDIWNPTMQGFLVQLMLYIVERPIAASPGTASPNTAPGSPLCRY
jgi:pimeloyl-ACP methyl ester carboxylesterase